MGQTVINTYYVTKHKTRGDIDFYTMSEISRGSGSFSMYGGPPSTVDILHKTQDFQKARELFQREQGEIRGNDTRPT